MTWTAGDGGEKDGDTVEVDVDLIGPQTVLALLCRDGNGRDVWIPKSLIRDPEVSDLEDMVPTIKVRLAEEYPSVTLTVPEWFAVREELV